MAYLEEIQQTHQLRLVVSTVIHKVSYIPHGSLEFLNESTISFGSIPQMTLGMQSSPPEIMDILFVENFYKPSFATIASSSKVSFIPKVGNLGGQFFEKPTYRRCPFFGDNWILNWDFFKKMPKTKTLWRLNVKNSACLTLMNITMTRWHPSPKSFAAKKYTPED